MSIKNYILRLYKIHLDSTCDALHDLNRYECLHEDRDSFRYIRLKLTYELQNLKLEIFKSLPYIRRVIKSNVC